MDIFLLFMSIIILMMAGVPIAISLGLSSMIFLLIYSDSSTATIAQSLFEAFQGHPLLLAIPFFILASAFMSAGGTAQRIIRFSIALVGHLRGGLAIASVLACMMFAALSGSSPATVVAIGTIVIGAMRQAGYSKEFAAGVICNAGTLGILIPPSIVMVVYAATVNVSVGRMFMAGVLPGLLAGLMLMIGIYIMARYKNMPAQAWKGWREIGDSFREAFWGLMLIVIIMVGIYGIPGLTYGIFTPTEAAAVASVYAFIVACFIYRDIGPSGGERRRGKADFAAKSSRPDNRVLASASPRDYAGRGQINYYADVCDCQCVAIKTRDYRGAITPANHRNNACLWLWSRDVFNCGECDFADWRAVYGAVRPAGYCRPIGVSDSDRAGHRPDSSRHYYGGEYGNRHADPARGIEPVCDLWRGGDVYDCRCAGGFAVLGDYVFVFNYRDLCAANINLSARYAVGTRESD